MIFILNNKGKLNSSKITFEKEKTFTNFSHIDLWHSLCPKLNIIQITFFSNEIPNKFFSLYILCYEKS